MLLRAILEQSFQLKNYQDPLQSTKSGKEKMSKLSGQRFANLENRGKEKNEEKEKSRKK